MGTAGAAMLGAGAGMMGGMLLVDAMTPHYAYAQPTIIGGWRDGRLLARPLPEPACLARHEVWNQNSACPLLLIADNTTIINNDNTSVLVDGGYGGYDGGFDGGYAYDGGASSAYAW